MNKEKRSVFIDMGRAESEPYEPGDEVKEEFEEVQRLSSGALRMLREMREHHSRTPVLSGGDLDADWRRADIGDETVGGSAPTPDQAVVDELGVALGLTYEDNEPLQCGGKVNARDRHRWELDPASSEDYKARVNHEGE